MSNAIQAICVLLGDEGCHFIFVEVDRVEWTEPRYFHQN